MEERKLASVRRIDEIKKHDNADSLDIAVIGGWQCVTAKTNGFKTGDLCIYCEIDSHLPVRPRYEFLRANSFKILESGREGFRIKTIRLRGQLSQGIIFPVSILPEGIVPVEDMDVTEILDIVKYEAPIPGQLSGEARGNFPPFIIKTDAERIQNMTKLWPKIQELEFEATLKLDGSSFTSYNWSETLGVCSRNIDLKETEGNKFWQAARKYRILDILPEGYAVQGELMGTGIQGNREGLTQNELFLFDVFDISKREYLLPDDREKFFKVLQEKEPTIRTVPILGRIKLKDFTMQSLLEYADGESLNNKVREGIVFRSTEKFNGEMVKFKVISNKFLLGEKE
jgi:RNA ligase (TIGR02306 family)